MSALELTLPDTDATLALGQALAHTFPGATDGHAGVYLEGDLGAGKTTCVRSMLRAFGVSGLIRSPTYTLIETYPLAAFTGVHVDLYRLRGATEADELGLRDFLTAGYLLMIEWPDKAAQLLPPADLEAAFTYAGSGRLCRLRAPTARGVGWLEKLRYDHRLMPYLSNLT